MTADELASRRDALNLTRPQLAERLGVPLSTVWRWEKGERHIPPHLDLSLRYLECERRSTSI